MNFLRKNLSLKKFLFSKKISGGRNNHGKITVFHNGGGHKKKYRIVDFFRRIRDIPGIIRRIEYDPNRTSFLALVCFKNSVLCYVLCGQDWKLGSVIISSNMVTFSNGNSTKISNMPIGSYIFNVEFFPFSFGKLARSAGVFCQVLKKLKHNYVLLRLPSLEMRLFKGNCFANYGLVSNGFKKFESLYKAGQNRYRSIRPTVRGEAKNPVDHPHGGNTSGGKHPRTPKGALTKGVKTRKNKSFFIFKTRHFFS